MILGLRFVMSIGSYAVGTAGGIFAPLLVLGGLVGLCVASVAHAMFPAAVPEPAAFAIVGMAAAFAGIVLPFDRRDADRRDDRSLRANLAADGQQFHRHVCRRRHRAPPVYDGLLESQLKK